MPTLLELSDPDARRAFALAVAEGAMRAQDASIDLNHGCKTDEDLIARIHAGHNIHVDFERLMRESDDYA